MLKTGLILMLLMLMMTPPPLIMKRTGPLIQTRSVVMYPMTVISGLLQMGTYGGDNEPPDIEVEVGDNEENPTKTINLPTVGKIIGGEKKNCMMALQCPR